jgi:predicted GH43/DUF377 family glycosyl hydrolase
MLRRRQLLLAKQQAQQQKKEETDDVTGDEACQTIVLPTKAAGPGTTFTLADVQCVPHEELLNPGQNIFFFNSSLVRNVEGKLLLVYRYGHNPPCQHDKVAACYLDDELSVVKGSNTPLPLHTNYLQSAAARQKSTVPFKQGEHCEDPRAILFNNHVFVVYTDGWSIGVAKLNPETLQVVYSHYLTTPSCIIPHPSKNHDGREKNWTPLPSKDSKTLCFIYSDSPRTILQYKDEGDRLVYQCTLLCPTSLSWRYGCVRGGTPAIPFAKGQLITFFHSSDQQSKNTIQYHIGAYVFQDEQPYRILKQTVVPLLSGGPTFGPKRERGSYSHPFVVFPCGAVRLEDGGFLVSLGVNDVDVGLLKVSKDQLEDVLVDCAPC